MRWRIARWPAISTPRAGLRAAGGALGLLAADPAAWFRGGVDDVAEIEAAIAERVAARKARDFARADAIRAELAAKGIVLEDGPAAPRGGAGGEACQVAKGPEPARPTRRAAGCHRSTKPY